MKNFLLSTIAALAMVIAPAAVMAQAAAGGVGVGITTGTYSATAASGGFVGGVIVNGQVGTFSQTSGTQSYASAGMAIGAVADASVHFAFDGVNNGVVGITRSSSASLEGFGTAGSQTTIAFAGDGFQAGLGAHVAFSNGAANSNGAFLGVGLIGATAASP